MSVACVFVDGVLKFVLGSKHALFVLLEDLVLLFLNFLGPLEFGLSGAFLAGPLLLEALQPPDFDFVQIVLLPQHLELLLHPDHQLILQLVQLDLQLSSLLLVLLTQRAAHVVGVLLHESVDPRLLADLQLAELLPEI